MSALGRLFGGGKKKADVPPSPQEAIQRLRQTEEMLEKKTDFLEKKIQQELGNAKRHGTKNKRGKSLWGPPRLYLYRHKLLNPTDHDLTDLNLLLSNSYLSGTTASFDLDKSSVRMDESL
jgi:hypothetical protein